MIQKRVPGSTANRRSFLQAGAAALGAGIVAQTVKAADLTGGQPTVGDIAILQFLAAVELVEADLWTQYSILADANIGFSGGLTNIDPALPRYNADIQRDEASHAAFINAYLASVGAAPTDLDAYRTILMPPVMGADATGHLTNLTKLTVDTSWYIKYRTPSNPDFGSMPSQFITITNQPGIPTSDNLAAAQFQAIANTATFHSASIEQAGFSLYSHLLAKVTSLPVLAILASIVPVEAIHFTGFHKALETMPGVTVAGVVFPDLRSDPSLARGIFPDPCPFLSVGLPDVAVVRPRLQPNAGAVYVLNALMSSGLFAGQSPAFFASAMQLATAADAAQRGF